MPHDSDVRMTSHDRHDPMLVAALAAGDLAGTDRDQAIALTDSCASCATLHADLVAIARATAALPPPIASAGRDFHLTPGQAASLRRTGWRRLVPTIPLRTATTRRLGVGLATIGLAGLLVGNVPLGMGMGGSAASPAGAPAAGALSAPQAPAASSAPAGNSGDGETVTAGGSVAAASVAPVAGYGPDTAGPIPSSPPASTLYGTSRDGVTQSRGPAVAGLPEDQSGGTKSDVTPPVAEPTVDRSSRPLNLVFGGAIVLGIALLIIARRRGSAPV
jgi:hypothetical protein